MQPENLLEAIQSVLPKVHGRAPKRSVLYRLCIEQGLLNRSEVARTTFYRLVNTFELLKPEAQTSNKVRLAFAKDHEGTTRDQQGDHKRTTPEYLPTPGLVCALQVAWRQGPLASFDQPAHESAAPTLLATATHRRK